MVDKRISELPELPSSDVSDGDWIVVTDSSTNTSKKLDFGDYKLTQSAADATTGRVTKVGDFGLGSFSGIPEYEDWNNINRGGFYNPGATAANGPGGTYNWGALSVPSFNGNNITQLGFRQSTTPSMYLRHKGGGTFYDWYEVYHSGNAVGTIADGALFETGSGPNGRWYKYADGRLEAHHQITLTFNTAARLSGTWTFPTGGLVSAPEITALLVDSNYPRDQLGALITELPTTSNVVVRQMRGLGNLNIAATDTATISVRMIGRWK